MTKPSFCGWDIDEIQALLQPIKGCELEEALVIATICDCSSEVPFEDVLATITAHVLVPDETQYVVKLGWEHIFGCVVLSTLFIGEIEFVRKWSKTIGKQYVLLFQCFVD